jgi:uncharacterized protein
MPETKKRETAYKLRINDVLRSTPVFDESNPQNKKLLFVEIGTKKIVRVNIIANIVDKYEVNNEKRFATITLDDGSGQLRARVFGEDIIKFKDLTQGDTILVIGILRYFNDEIYILPELIKKQDTKYLLIRKLEIEKSYSYLPSVEQKKEIKVLREEIVKVIKKEEENEGIDKDEIIMRISAEPAIISQEIQILLEEGIIYEPKPGRVRFLG